MLMENMVQLIKLIKPMIVIGTMTIIQKQTDLLLIVLMLPEN